MNNIAGRTFGAGVLAILACGAARAQELPPAAPLAHPAHPVHHVHHRHHTIRYHHVPPTAVAPGGPGPQADSAGTTPAPVPNEDIGPPPKPQDTQPSVDPGSLRIHYPPLGNGYLPGSSPQDMANEQTPAVPGATVKVPLQQATPQPLPPPGGALPR